MERFGLKAVCRLFAQKPDHGLYELMNRLAEEALEEGGGAPKVATQFYGSRRQADAAGRIEGLTYRNFTLKHLVLGFLDGVAEELLSFVAMFPQPVRDGIAAVCGSGNGIRRNPAMRRLLQMKLQLPVRVAMVEEERAYGASIHAAVGIGLFED